MLIVELLVAALISPFITNSVSAAVTEYDLPWWWHLVVGASILVLLLVITTFVRRTWRRAVWGWFPRLLRKIPWSHIPVPVLTTRRGLRAKIEGAISRTNPASSTDRSRLGPAPQNPTERDDVGSAVSKPGRTAPPSIAIELTNEQRIAATRAEVALLDAHLAELDYRALDTPWRREEGQYWHAVKRLEQFRGEVDFLRRQGIALNARMAEPGFDEDEEAQEEVAGASVNFNDRYVTAAERVADAEEELAKIEDREAQAYVAPLASERAEVSEARDRAIQLLDRLERVKAT
ncbi:hypothetical protein [Microbacterium sp. SLBN-146]|uniref:hypothetical protein n=1 Tax=Microbacterium sp. SLBN-146 TaxID=2768457 RepID=UPI001C9302FA|nr:hypothetical protein [Microbacterium sp. SLBN-146]